MTGTERVEQGEVEGFDAERGSGTVRAADGAVYYFHCTQIAGGSRMIPAGVPVTFAIRPGHRGRWEAAAVTPVA